jgi:hypothetical protein
MPLSKSSPVPHWSGALGKYKADQHPQRLILSPDGTVLVAINSQGKAHIWRAPSLQEIERIEEAKP